MEERANDVVALADDVVFIRNGTNVWRAEAADVDKDRLVHSYLGLDGAPAGRS